MNSRFYPIVGDNSVSDITIDKVMADGARQPRWATAAEPVVCTGRGASASCLSTLAAAFVFNALVFSALSAHLIPLTPEYGHAARLAVLSVALIGTMQLAARVLERSCDRLATRA